MRILVTGASGAIGDALIPALASPGDTIRAFARTPARVRGAGVDEVVQGDAVTGAGLAEALDGVDVAYYLIHSMEPAAEGDGSFPERELGAAAQLRRRSHAPPACGVSSTSAGSCRQAARPAGTWARGWRSRRRCSAPRRRSSRCAPRSSSARASRSFRFLVRLVERVPVMPLPTWRDFRTRPIDGRDVIAYLVAAGRSPRGRRPAVARRRRPRRAALRRDARADPRRAAARPPAHRPAVRADADRERRRGGDRRRAPRADRAADARAETPTCCRATSARRSCSACACTASTPPWSARCASGRASSRSQAASVARSERGPRHDPDRRAAQRRLGRRPRPGAPRRLGDDPPSPRRARHGSAARRLQDDADAVTARRAVPGEVGARALRGPAARRVARQGTRRLARRDGVPVDAITTAGRCFDYRNEFEAPLGLLGRVAQRAVAGDIPQVQAQRSLERLKKLCES